MGKLEKCLVIGDRTDNSELVSATIVDPESTTLTALLLTEHDLLRFPGERDKHGDLVDKVIPLGSEEK